MCDCTRSRSATFGRVRSAPRRSPGWATTGYTMWLFFRERPTARWRVPRLARSSARHPKSATSVSSRRFCWTRRPRYPRSRRWTRRASSSSWWRPTRKATRRGGRRRCCTPARMSDQPPAYDIAALLAAHPSRAGGRRDAEAFDEHGIQYGPAFTGLAAAHTAEGTVSTVLAEVGLPGPIRSQQARLRRASRVAGCLFPVGSGSSRRPGRRQPAACCCRWVCAGSVPTVLPAPPVTATPE